MRTNLIKRHTLGIFGARRTERFDLFQVLERLLVKETVLSDPRGICEKTYTDVPVDGITRESGELCQLTDGVHEPPFTALVRRAVTPGTMRE